MPPAYADIFTSGTGIITTPYVVLEADLEQHNAKILFQLLVNPLTWVLPLPIIQTLQVHRRPVLHHQRLKQLLNTDYSCRTELFQLSLKSCRKGQERKVRLLTPPDPQVVVQVATPPPAGPVKKTYRKVKKTPVVPKPEDQ